MRSIARVAATAVALSLALTAFAQQEHPECGSSPELTQWARELGAWSSGRAARMASKGLQPVAAMLRDNVYLLPADESNAPFRHPFDLEGRTLRFTRRGTSGFSVTNLPLAYDEERGALAPWFSTIGDMSIISLGFDYPFYDTTVTQVYVSRFNAIFLAAATIPNVKQFGEVDVATIRQPVIAPLLTSDSSEFGPPPAVWLKKTADAVTFTWTVTGRYDVQAVLFRSGDVSFSYKTVSTRPLSVGAGAVVISSGHEPWRSETSSLASTTDPSGDQATTLTAQLAPLYDITGVTVSTVAGSDMLEIRIDTRDAVDRSIIPSNEPVIYNVAFGPVSDQQYARLYLYSLQGNDRYILPVWGSVYGSSAARVEGSSIILDVMQEHLAGVRSPEVRVSTLRGSRATADSVAVLSVPLSAPARRVGTDFSALSTGTFENVPIMETFTLPILSVYRVWEQLKQSDPTLTDAAIDGVAIYQNFYTDLVTFAGAYSTGGNAAASGLASDDDAALTMPRSPALCHMNKVEYGYNAASRSASHVVLHEFGHRWLLFVSLMENGAKTYRLNPLSAHPAQFVDTRSAFKIHNDQETSVMGGGHFTDNHNGTFSTADYGPYGYSWLDLYLMGLASPSEVGPFFYVADSVPELGGAYYAPENETFSGRRVEVTLQQIIDATGVRRPAYPATQRDFKVIFVLVTEPGREPTPEELEWMRTYRSLMEADFRTATNSRASVSTAVVPPPSGPRRRAIRH